MASNIEATKKGYEAFQRGDIPSLMKDLLHDDCTWIAPGPKDKLPWAGTFRGQDDPPGNRTRNLIAGIKTGDAFLHRLLRKRTFGCGAISVALGH